MNEIRKLMETLNKISEDDYENSSAYAHGEDGGPPESTQLKSEEDFFNRILKLTGEADELLDSDKPIDQKFRVLDQILQDIDVMTRLRQMGRDYEDIEESEQIMKVINQVTESHRTDNVSLADLSQNMEQPYDDIYVKLREEYNEETAERYKDAMDIVWGIVLDAIEYGHEGYHPTLGRSQ